MLVGNVGFQIIILYPFKVHFNCFNMWGTGLPNCADGFLTQAIYKCNEADNRTHDTEFENLCWWHCWYRNIFGSSPVAHCLDKKNIVYHFTGGFFHPMVSLGSRPWVQIRPSYAKSISLNSIWKTSINQSTTNSKICLELKSCSSYSQN